MSEWKEQGDPRVRYAREGDRDVWFALDGHLPPEEYALKVRDRRAYVLEAGDGIAAILRYALFWDSIPFCTLLYVREGERRRGRGRALMAHWEQDMKRRGYGLVMTSTQADEEAQHFYRALGYRDCGGLLLPFPGFEQPLEVILAKPLCIADGKNRREL